jgi:hypothetical protein
MTHLFALALLWAAAGSHWPEIGCGHYPPSPDALLLKAPDGRLLPPMRSGYGAEALAPARPAVTKRNVSWQTADRDRLLKKYPPALFDSIPDPEARAIVARAIQRSGGWVRYQALDSIAYRKRSILYDSLGLVESDRTELHRYRLRPSLSMRISWHEGKSLHELSYGEDGIFKSIDGRIAETGAAQLRQIADGALFVLFMPFKLLDGAAALSYQGPVELPDGRQADAIAADYEQGDNWFFYFDRKTGDFIANTVMHGTGAALIVNDAFITAGGLRFNARRTSYRLDAQGNIAYRRGEFFYDEFDVP